ncbi:MAG: hypothetical protein OXB99_07495 [Acidimicrobiaceae bacterium]|nr:hypothetical protein [Acidimicrobiaceae bacterium]
MNVWAYFLASQHDPRLAHDWTYPDGVVTTSHRRHLRIEEMLAWSRWQLGWLADDQVHCVSEDDLSGGMSVTLSPLAQPGDGIAMVAVPLNAHQVLVAESRRKLGYDAGRFFEADDTGATTTFPRLITEGVLVYTVDTFIGSGELPVKVAGDSGNGQVDEFPLLEPGEGVSLRGYTITLTADDGDTHTVLIEKQ